MSRGRGKSPFGPAGSRAGESIDQSIGRAIARWVGFVARAPGLVLAATAVLTLAMGVYAAGHLGINADEDAMLSNELPHRMFELEYHEFFPSLYENVVVVIDAETPERARDGAASLADRLRAEPSLFSRVYLPEGEFFEQHGLLYLETEELEDFADRLARFQPYLSGLSYDGTLRGLATLMARGTRGARERDVEPQEIVPLYDRFSAAVRAQLDPNSDGQSYQLSWAEVLAQRELDIDARRRILLVQPVFDFSDISPARRSLSALKTIAADLGLDEAHGVRVRMTGDAALAFEEMQIVESQARWAGVASFAIVSAILFLALRSIRLVAATMLTLLAGLVLTGGFAAVALGHLNLISASFAVLYIGLGVDFGVHFCLRYQELYQRGEAHESAMIETARGVGASLVLCACTTAIGFFAFVPTDFAGVAELGLIAGAGMFISVFLSFTLLPALMSLRRPPGATGSAGFSGPSLPSFPTRYPRAVGVAAMALGVLALLLLPRVTFDQNPLRVRDPSADSVQALAELLARKRATPWELNAVAADLPAAEALAAELTALPTVDRAITLRDFVPADQHEKLAIIEDVSIFLAPPPTADGTVELPTHDEQVAGLVELRDELERWMRESAAPPLPDSASRVHADLLRLLRRLEVDKSAASLVENLEESLLGGLPRHLELLETLLDPDLVTIESLPPALLERMVSRNGKVRVRVFPSEDLSDNAALERFVLSVRQVAGDVQGGAINIYEASNAVVRALRQAFAAAVLIIALLLLLIWRALGDAALVLIPLALAAIFTAACAVLIGIPFNFADVIVLPLLLGIGVDSGIHLVHRARMREGDLLSTSTARAVVFSSLTTIASFGTLGFSSHLGMASLGQLLTLGVALTVLCNLVVLPALIAWRDRVVPPTKLQKTAS